MHKITWIILLIVSSSQLINAQQPRGGYIYSNLKGVTRYGVDYNYQKNASNSFGINYLSLNRNKHYKSFHLNYMEKVTGSEKATSIKGSMKFGRFITRVGQRFYIRGTLGPEIGYEWKKSLLINDKINFLFLGASVGIEPEYFISNTLVLFIGVQEYAHYYKSNVRANWNAYGGIRISIK